MGGEGEKRRVREIFGVIVRNDFPGAFVNIVYDPEVLGKVFTKHPDGDGSKLAQRILHYLETGDATVIQGAVDDAFSMNAGDIAIIMNIRFPLAGNAGRRTRSAALFFLRGKW